jgi:hypothetical protein
MTATAAHLRLPAGIYRKLAALRRRVYLWLTLHGAAQLALTLVGTVLVSLALDWTFRLDRISRAILLLAAVGTLLALTVRWLIRPLLGHLSDDALALRVERQNPHLGQGLISALQFARDEVPDPQLASPQLLRAAIEQGTRAVAEADFGRVLDRRFRRRAGASAIAALCALAALAAAFAADAASSHPYWGSKWFRRNVLLTDDRWNPRVVLRLLPVDDPQRRVTRGDNYEQQVEVLSGRAGRLLLRFRYGAVDARGQFQPDGSGTMTEELSRLGAGVPVRYAAEVRNVTRSFQVCADAGADAVTPWRSVCVVERPRLDALHLACRRPDYTQPDPARRIDHFPLDNGAYETVRGSSLSFEGLCSKPLASAQVVCHGQSVASVELIPDPVAASLEPPPAHRFRGTIGARDLVTGVYSFKVVDTDGVELDPANPTELKITVVPDRPPEVRADKVGIGTLVTARAVIPLRCDFKDDFGVVGAALLYKLGAHAGPQTTWGPPQTVPITDEDLVKKLPACAAACLYRFNVGPLKLAPGTAVWFQVQARDNCPPPEGPNLGTSGEQTVTVVTDEELRRDLLRREQEQRAQFERLIHDQQKLQTDVQSVLDHLKRNPRLAPADLDLLAAAERRQRQVGDTCSAVAARFAQMLAEVLNNDLEHQDDPAPRRLRQAIIDPLGVLAGQWVPAAAEDLDTAHRVAADDALRRRAVAAAVDTQDQMLRLMEDTLNAMQKYESYQQAVIELRRILGDTEQAAAQIQQEGRRLLLGGDSPVPLDPPPDVPDRPGNP